ncbi:hypothetical protein EVAR_93836_1 [Eumeta japonica]|uniref:Uncharacterized protein n=1 Tax=Eumeta variegata TaxID=151549 RepID=A0A4C1TX28_EUMVA|nr:hypothetical protein EVAR_93836_1 [Eumeta japonica]
MRRNRFGITGDVIVDKNGDRIASYSLLDMNPETSKFEMQTALSQFLALISSVSKSEMTVLPSAKIKQQPFILIIHTTLSCSKLNLLLPLSEAFLRFDHDGRGITPVSASRPSLSSGVNKKAAVPTTKAVQFFSFIISPEHYFVFSVKLPVASAEAFLTFVEECLIYVESA